MEYNIVGVVVVRNKSQQQRSREKNKCTVVTLGEWQEDWKGQLCFLPPITGNCTSGRRDLTRRLWRRQRRDVFLRACPSLTDYDGRVVWFWRPTLKNPPSCFLHAHLSWSCLTDSWHKPSLYTFMSTGATFWHVNSFTEHIFHLLKLYGI